MQVHATISDTLKSRIIGTRIVCRNVEGEYLHDSSPIAGMVRNA